MERQLTQVTETTGKLDLEKRARVQADSAEAAASASDPNVPGPTVTPDVINGTDEYDVDAQNDDMEEYSWCDNANNATAGC
jgi:hypothetical protein